jgi:hypothetical protein
MVNYIDWVNKPTITNLQLASPRIFPSFPLGFPTNDSNPLGTAPIATRGICQMQTSEEQDQQNSFGNEKK